MGRSKQPIPRTSCNFISFNSRYNSHEIFIIVSKGLGEIALLFGISGSSVPARINIAHRLWPGETLIDRKTRLGCARSRSSRSRGMYDGFASDLDGWRDACRTIFAVWQSRFADHPARLADLIIDNLSISQHVECNARKAIKGKA